ncbi:MAG: glucuronate isomerase [Gemmatimonadaceae bacterium]
MNPNLHPDRFFDPDPTTRRIARALYERASELPLICPHGHVDPALLAHNAPFPEPSSLIVIPDHYLLRMLYSQGVPLEDLGVTSRDGSLVESDPRVIWRLFAANYFLFRGTPSRAWLDFELHEVFDVQLSLAGDTADLIYDEISEKLLSPEFRPHALFERFRIETLATTDRATDPLEHHRAIQASGLHGRVIPTFRPDGLFAIANDGWLGELKLLAESVGREISTFDDFVAALATRRDFFRTMGGTATDHGVMVPHTERMAKHEVDQIFGVALRRDATPGDERRFEAHMLMEMARMSVDDGLVMQLHAGSMRNHNSRLWERFGPDKGADIPVVTEYTRNLHALLNEFGNDPAFSLIVFTLDESAYSRELAPLAGHYPSLKLGPPWWFHDSLEGMERFRDRTLGTAGIYNTAGFNDDTRAFCSIPARHDLSRRADANFLARMVVRHIIGEEEAEELVWLLAYELARKAYKLDSIDGAR